jgi:hypothetical protein
MRKSEKMVQIFEEYMSMDLKRLLEEPEIPIGDLGSMARQKLITDLQMLAENLVRQAARSDPETFIEYPGGEIGLLANYKAPAVQH